MRAISQTLLLFRSFIQQKTHTQIHVYVFDKGVFIKEIIDQSGKSISHQVIKPFEHIFIIFGSRTIRFSDAVSGWQHCF